MSEYLGSRFITFPFSWYWASQNSCSTHLCSQLSHAVDMVVSSATEKEVNWRVHKHIFDESEHVYIQKPAANSSKPYKFARHFVQNCMTMESMFNLSTDQKEAPICIPFNTLCLKEIPNQSWQTKGVLCCIVSELAQYSCSGSGILKITYIGSVVLSIVIVSKDFVCGQHRRIMSIQHEERRFWDTFLLATAVGKKNV